MAGRKTRGKDIGVRREGTARDKEEEHRKETDGNK
jgi:hypothetical protein